LELEMGNVPVREDYLRRVADIGDVVRAEAPAGDRARVLGEKTVAALQESGLLRMALPAGYGGGNLAMGDTFPVYEALARINGSAGWNLAIGVTTAGQALGLGDDAREEVLGDPATVVAGTINFLAVNAARVDGGYVFDGNATFLSGSAYASWLVIGGMLRDGGAPVLDASGLPTIVRGLTPISSLELTDTWHVSGMRATASNDAPVEALFIPDRFICAIDHPGLTEGDPARGLPLLSRFGAGLAFVGLGTARGALDALVAVAAEKVLIVGQPLRERPDVQVDAARALGLIEAGRAFVSQTWHAVQDKAQAGQPVGSEDQMMLRLSYITAVEHATQAADLAFRAGGSSSLFEANGIERAWRDTHAVSKHLTVSVRLYDRLGRVVLGLPPAPGFM
jgi:alkylation response protein AidB-like acyl-CoA dehydrogenase